jgi:hypothetical protein
MSTAPQLLLGYSQRMQPKEVVKAWVEAFNRGDADKLSFLKLHGLPLET